MKDSIRYKMIDSSIGGRVVSRNVSIRLRNEIRRLIDRLS